MTIAAETKPCRKCGLGLPLDSFAKGGRYPYCRTCEAARVREYYAKNPTLKRQARRKDYESHRERYIKKARDWNEHNPERRRQIQREVMGRRRAQTGERLDYDLIAERDQWHCYLCEQAVDSSHEWPHPMSPSYDHVIPLARDGEHTYENVRLTHLSCNMKKSARLLEEVA